MITSSLLRRLIARARDLHANKRGSTAVVAAIVFPIAIGGMGLGAETGYWYLSQRKLQHAADVSAHAAGVRLRAGDNTTKITAAAQNIATVSGLSTSVGTLVVNAPPLSGPKTGVAGYVEVILTEVQPRLFSSVFSSQPVTIRTRAVVGIAAANPRTACILALSQIAAGAITISASTNVALDGCDMASNSSAANSLLMSASSSGLAAECISVSGQAVTTSGLNLQECNSITTNAPVSRDPYASVAEPSAIGACQATSVGTSTLTPTDTQPNGVKSMRFCNGLTATGTVTFSPGLYIIENGGLTLSGTAKLIGSGVTFYFVNGGNLSTGSTGTLTLSAPTSGPYSGILFFGSRATAGANQTIAGTTTSTVTGAIYMPASHLTFTGKSTSTSGCTQIIADTITFTGSSSLGSTCDYSSSKKIIPSEAVSIVE